MIAELTKKDVDKIEFIQKILNGHRDAAVFVAMMFQVLHLWDDLIDKDKPTPDEEINLAMFLALVQIPRNPFYRANFAELSPIVSSAIINWMYATQQERLAPSEVTFIVRSDYINLLLKSAEIVGGAKFAAEQQAAVRDWFHGEGYQGYLINLGKEKEVRNEAQAPKE